MKAIPINIDGIQFRSKLEGRHYLFMKKLGWNIEYEPEIEGIHGWIPDFIIIGKDHKILVDVKPIHNREDWLKHPDHDKILNSGINKLHDYELLILGTNINFNGTEKMGVFYSRDKDWLNAETIILDSLSEDHSPIFSHVDGQIGFMTYEGNWKCRITGEGGKTYIFREYHPELFRKIDRYWNEAGSQLQWNSPTSEHYLQDKKHPNSNQYCMDCENESVNYWKKTNLFYCNECRQVKPIFTWSGEPLKSPKYYAYKNVFHHLGIVFYYSTANSQDFQKKH